MINNLVKTRSVISFVILLFILAYTLSLFVFSIPVENKDMVNILLGTILGRVDNIITYYFGDTHEKSN